MTHYKPLTDEQTKMVLSILLALKSDRQNVCKEIAEVFTDDFIAKVICKRINVLNLPKLTPDAILFISLLAEGNPGKSVLMLIETLEKAEELKISDINIEFIMTDVYPWGFYQDDIFAQEFDQRREKHDQGYNRLI